MAIEYCSIGDSFPLVVGLAVHPRQARVARPDWLPSAWPDRFWPAKLTDESVAQWLQFQATASYSADDWATPEDNWNAKTRDRDKTGNELVQRAYRVLGLLQEAGHGKCFTQALTITRDFSLVEAATELNRLVELLRESKPKKRGPDGYSPEYRYAEIQMLYEHANGAKKLTKETLSGIKKRVRNWIFDRWNAEEWRQLSEERRIELERMRLTIIESFHWQTQKPQHTRHN